MMLGACMQLQAYIHGLLKCDALRKRQFFAVLKRDGSLSSSLWVTSNPTALCRVNCMNWGPHSNMQCKGQWPTALRPSAPGVSGLETVLEFSIDLMSCLYFPLPPPTCSVATQGSTSLPALSAIVSGSWSSASPHCGIPVEQPCQRGQASSWACTPKVLHAHLAWKLGDHTLSI